MMEISPARFQGDVPTLDDVISRAQSMCEVKIEHAVGEVRFAGENRPGALVHLSHSGSSIFLRHLAGDAPALRLLLQHVLIALGGEFSFKPRALQFPLTAENIARIDREERCAVNKASLALLALIVVAFLAAVTLLAGVAWAVFAWVHSP